MRVKSLIYSAILIALTLAFAIIGIDPNKALGQTSNPLVDDRPVKIVRKQKPNRKPKQVRRARVVVQSVPLLKLQWRVLKVSEDGSQHETSPVAVFHVGDRLRLAVKTNQDGFLYVIHQESPTEPGQIIFPDSRVNGGRNDVGKGQEFILPSNCPAGTSSRDCALIVTPPAGQEVFTVVFSRDPFTDLPNTAAEAGGGIPVESLIKLKSDSGQTLRRIKGSTPLSVLVVNTNTKDNEDIFETLVLNKGQ
jgi:Domain of unknown function (DUF4384)